MGKAKQEASARADELLKSYNVKLNPMAGTYRLEDKASGKEVNVERSGVDVGTSWLASGRRANRLIGKNLVQRSSTSFNNSTPPAPTEKTGAGTAGNQKVSGTNNKPIPIAGEENTTPVMLRGLPKDQPQYQWQVPNISSIWNSKGATTNKETTPALGNNKVYGSRFGSGALTDYTPNLGNPTVGTFDPIMSKAQIRQGLVARQTAPVDGNKTTTTSVNTTNSSYIQPDDLDTFVKSFYRYKGYTSPEAYKRRENITEQSPDVIAWRNKLKSDQKQVEARKIQLKQEEQDKKDKLPAHLRFRQRMVDNPMSPASLYF